MPMPTTIRSSVRTYLVQKSLMEGETYDLSLAKIAGDTKDRQVIIKTVGEISLNAYGENEAAILRMINDEYERTKASPQIKLMIPELLDAFEIDGRTTVVTDYADGYSSLEEILAAYPQGVAPVHVAWIFNRMLHCLMAAHSTGVVHGKLLPRHMLIRSGNRQDELRHTGVLVDWTCAVKESKPGKWPKLGAMSEDYADFYPREVIQGKPVSPLTDLAMAAQCALYLLGGDVKSGEVPELVPWQMAQLLRLCCHPNPAVRPRTVYQLYDQFQQMLLGIYGNPLFVELSLPPRP